jgi:hypothetical protein
MDLYYIVKKGDPPGNEGAANLGGICDAWSRSPEKDETEVIAVSFKGTIRRLTASESEKLARDFRSPKIG